MGTPLDDQRTYLVAPGELCEELLGGAARLSEYEVTGVRLEREKPEPTRSPADYLNTALVVIGHVSNVVGLGCFVADGIKRWRASRGDMESFSMLVIGPDNVPRQITIEPNASGEEIVALLRSTTESR
jgi:hypothetical protein